MPGYSEVVDEEVCVGLVVGHGPDEPGHHVGGVGLHCRDDQELVVRELTKVGIRDI